MPCRYLTGAFCTFDSSNKSDRFPLLSAPAPSTDFKLLTRQNFSWLTVRHRNNKKERNIFARGVFCPKVFVVDTYRLDTQAPFSRTVTETRSENGRIRSPDVTSAFETALWKWRAEGARGGRGGGEGGEGRGLQMSLHFNATVRGARSSLIDSRRRPIGLQIIGLEEKSDYRLNERDYKQTVTRWLRRNRRPSRAARRAGKKRRSGKSLVYQGDGAAVRISTV